MNKLYTHAMPILADQTQRQQALDPQQSFIVQAPAGSGKTALLIARILTLLPHCQQPEQVLAITFTRKAAYEMRERILNALQQATQAKPTDPFQQQLWLQCQAVLQKDQQQQWHLLQNPNRLRIHTIDALCMQITQQMPITTNISSHSQINQQPLPLYEQAVDHLFQHTTEKDPWYPAMAQLLSHMNLQMSPIKRLLVTMLQCRDQWLPHLVPHGASLKHILKQCLQSFISEQLQLAYNLLPTHWHDELQTIWTYLHNQTKTHNTPPQILGSPQIEDLNSWQQLCTLLLTKQHQWRQTVTKKQGFAAPSSLRDPIEKQQASEIKKRMLSLLEQAPQHPQLRRQLELITHCPQSLYNHDETTIIEALSTLLPTLSAQLSVIFQQHQTADFTEISLKALQALSADHGPSDISLALDWRIHHILLDEFQDTSMSQYHLLKQLTSGWQPNEHRSLFIVGDPMQSIYRFRQAEVGLFKLIQTQGLHHIQPIALTLTTNFRSQPTLIDWVNQVGHTVFSKQPLAHSGEVSFVPAVAASQTQPTTSSATCHFCADDPQAQAAHVVQIIRQEKQRDHTQRIAILVRSRNHLQAIIPALDKAQINYQAQQIHPLYQHNIIQDLITLTRAIHHLADRTAWFAVLRAPWCGLSLADLLVMAADAESTTIWAQINHPEQQHKLTENGRMRLNRVLTPLNNAIYQRHQHSNLRTTIETTWHALSGPQCYTEPNPLIIANAYFDHLENWLHNHPQYHAEAHSEALQSLYAPPNTNDNNPVEIMTIHKAKGLEFDCVIIPDCQRSGAHNPNPLLLWQQTINSNQQHELLMAPLPNQKITDSAYDLLKHLDRQQNHNELKRLLYVAITRAKSHLYCIAQKPEKQTSKQSFLYLLQDCFNNTHEQHSNTTPLPSMTTQQTSSIIRLNDQWQATHPVQAIQPVLDAGNRYQPEPITTNSACGSVIHHILYQLSQCHPLPTADSAWLAQQQNHWEQLLHHYLYPNANLQPALTTIQQAITSTLSDPRGQWILSNHHNAHSEYHLVNQHPTGHQSHIIDRTFIDQQQRWIIDYKCTPCDNLNDDFLTSQWGLHQEQLMRYAKLFSQPSATPIQLALYFPLCRGWIQQAYTCETHTQQATQHGD